LCLVVGLLLLYFEWFLLWVGWMFGKVMIDCVVGIMFLFVVSLVIVFVVFVVWFISFGLVFFW